VLTARVQIKGTKGTIAMTNWMIPSIYHSITVTAADGPQRVERVYGNGANTYYRQLKGLCGYRWRWRMVLKDLTCLPRFNSDCACTAAFAEAVQQQKSFSTTAEDGVRNMAVVDAVYKKAGLPVRGAGIQ